MDNYYGHNQRNYRPMNPQNRPASTTGHVVAVAHLRGSSEAPRLRGVIEFAPWRDGTLVTARITGLPVNENHSGFFAFHVHEGTNCDDAQDGNAFQQAGAHYNPTNQPHPMHAGDLPALLSSKNGDAFSRVYTDRFTPDDIIGRTAIVHAQPDDYHTQPAGNAGARIACGQIERV